MITLQVDDIKRGETYFKNKQAIQKFLASLGLTETDVTKTKRYYCLHIAHNNQLYCLLLPSVYCNISIVALEKTLLDNNLISRKVVEIPPVKITELIHFGGNNG